MDASRDPRTYYVIAIIVLYLLNSKPAGWVIDMHGILSQTPFLHRHTTRSSTHSAPRACASRAWGPRALVARACVTRGRRRAWIMHASALGQHDGLLRARQTAAPPQSARGSVARSSGVCSAHQLLKVARLLVR